MWRACTTTKGSAVHSIGRCAGLRATTRSATGASMSSNARRWSMRMVRGTGTPSFVCYQLEYRVSSESSSGRATRLLHTRAVVTTGGLT